MNEVPITRVGRRARDSDLRHRSDGVAVVRFKGVVSERESVNDKEASVQYDVVVNEIGASLRRKGGAP